MRNRLTSNPKRFRLFDVKQSQLAEVMSWLGKRSYTTRVQRFGIERIREIARAEWEEGRATAQGAEGDQTLERAVPVLLTPTRR